jgi:hypothetical protein
MKLKSKRSLISSQNATREMNVYNLQLFTKSRVDKCKIAAIFI